MKKLIFVLLITMTILGVLAQDRASMHPPIVRGTPEEISLVARFTDFAAGQEYRIGVGSVAGSLPSATIELAKDDSPVGGSVVEFEQGYAGSWWGVDKVQARGYELSGPTVPVGQEVTLRFKIARPDAEAAEKLFVFVSKKYGETVWYIEDGVEINKGNW